MKRSLANRRRLGSLATSTLRGWLTALEACPAYVPFVVDLRIAVRSELWQRDLEAEQIDGWLLGAITDWN